MHFYLFSCFAEFLVIVTQYTFLKMIFICLIISIRIYLCFYVFVCLSTKFHLSFFILLLVFLVFPCNSFLSYCITRVDSRSCGIQNFTGLWITPRAAFLRKCFFYFLRNLSLSFYMLKQSPNSYIINFLYENHFVKKL